MSISQKILLLLSLPTLAGVTGPLGQLKFHAATVAPAKVCLRQPAFASLFVIVRQPKPELLKALVELKAQGVTVRMVCVTRPADNVVENALIPDNPSLTEGVLINSSRFVPLELVSYE